MGFVDENFGINVFNDSVMRQRLPKETYKALHKTIDDGRRLDPQVASVVANAMKDWALERGATHYTHWFQPLYFSRSGRKGHPGVFRQGACPGGSGCLISSQRRPSFHL